MGVACGREEVGAVSCGEVVHKRGFCLLVCRGHEALLDVVDGCVLGEGEELGNVSAGEGDRLGSVKRKQACGP